LKRDESDDAIITIQIVRCIKNAYFLASCSFLKFSYSFQEILIIISAKTIEKSAISDNGFNEERPKTANTSDA
jgi:hypothetical protein